MRRIFFILMLAVLGMTQVVAQEYEYVPFVREGVKWKYVVSHYDEISEKYTHQYFYLEFKGDTILNGKTYKMMHKYSTVNPNPENDTIPVFMREENKIVYAITPQGSVYPDCLVGLYYGSPDNLGGEEFILYDFNNPTDFWKRQINDFHGEGADAYLTASVDTIQVGEHKSKCYAYSIMSNTSFCIVEGVGYDSQLGYTLYPFIPSISSSPVMYGLIHVVENGEIVYKSRFSGDDGIDEVAADRRRLQDTNYYDLMGRPVGHAVPTTPGIYIHQGKKIVVR